MNDEVPGLGWVGTGRMGAALAGRLIDAGQRVTVWNRTPAKTGPLVARGAGAADRITDLGGCDIVFVTVSGPHDLEEVVAELLSGESRPGVIVDCSTVSAGASARVRASAEAAGGGVLALPGRDDQGRRLRGRGRAEPAGKAVPQPVPRHDGPGAGRGDQPGREGRYRPRRVPGVPGRHRGGLGLGAQA